MLVLASKSPRRKEILKEIIPDFKIEPSDFKEDTVKIDAEYLPLLLAMAKAQSVFIRFPNDLILASDTIVILNRKIYGKPKDKEDAKRMLKELSNKKHKVITGYAFKSKDVEIHGRVTTYVYFNKLDDDLISKYVETGSPLDKAGAYGIQDKEFNLVKKIKGSYTNVVGLPKERIEKEISRIKKNYPNLLL